MLKINLKDLPVITIHINDADKKALQAQADKNGMQLATYCRMVLLNSLKEGK
jgi:predicted DNA binding CopG/RHH family protein